MGPLPSVINQYSGKGRNQVTKAVGLVTVFFVGGAIALAQVPGPA